jgi:hypothetical protein
MMTEREHKEFSRFMRKRLQEIKHSKAAAREVLERAGILHLLVPIGTKEAHDKFVQSAKILGREIPINIQICIRNPNCIKGYFLPRKETRWPMAS